MVRHDYVAVELIVAESAFLKLNSFRHHAGDLPLSKIKRGRAGVVEKAIHRCKSFSGTRTRRKPTAYWKTTVKAPG
jgi:hypothetical protein